MLNPEFEADFFALVDRAGNNGALDQKTTTLLFLTAAMALGCAPCVRRFMDKAGSLGLTEEETGAALAVAMCVRAGSARAHTLEALGLPVEPPAGA